MRATFGVVLVAGIAAAAGMSMVLRHGTPAEAQAAKTRSASLLDPKPGSPPVAAPVPEPRAEPEPASDTARANALPALAARVEDLLARNDLAGAAGAVFAADGKELRDAGARERVFRVAEALVASSESAPDSTATRQRVDARRIYGSLYRCDDTTAPEAARAFEGAEKLNKALLFGNGAPEDLALRHKVLAGESVWALARGPWKQRGVSVPPGFVLHVNGIADAKRVRVGQTLRVPLEPMRILVKKSRFDLAVLLGGVPVERFPVAIGADSSTPTGVFKVSDRIKEPDWYLHGRRIPYGDPQNIIGTRWIGLSGSAAIEGIGIHGTADDASVGRAVSMGCVRMHNADVEKLFEWLDSGIEVEIRD